MTIELDPVSRITAGAVGEPGRRTFYLQASQGQATVSVIVEKEHVIELARHTEALLASLDRQAPAPEEAVDSADLVLREPLEPAFRAGRIALGYDPQRDLLVVECEELVEEGDEGEVARFWATRSQMRALARRGAEVAAAGRPRCPWCGGPVEMDGTHLCVATNGHRRR